MFAAVWAVFFCVFSAEAGAETGKGFVALTASADNWQFTELRQVTAHLGIRLAPSDTWWSPDHVWLALGELHREQSNGSRVSAGVGWRYRFDESSRWFVDLGFAPTYLTRRHYPHSLSQRYDMGSRFQFATRLSVNWMLTDSTGLLLQYEHLSNGGFWSVNPGTDHLGLGIYLQL
jgi:hypothetical protein